MPDIHAVAARIREQEGEVNEISESASGLSAGCRDNQGTPFSLWQPAPDF